MAKVDDLLERRAKQVVLAIVARLAHRSPRQRISPSKESRTAQSGNPKPQENSHAHPAFLQNRLLAQVKSSRSINRFLILHGRLISVLSANLLFASQGQNGTCPMYGPAVRCKRKREAENTPGDARDFVGECDPYLEPIEPPGCRLDSGFEAVLPITGSWRRTAPHSL